MDPLSLTASIITVVGAASTVSRGLKKILSARNLPHIVLQLNNEVTDLQVVIQDVEDLLCRRAQVNREDRKPLQKQESLVRALEHANQTLLALQSLIACKLTTVDSRDGRIKFKRKSWLLVESRVKSLKDEIRTDRLRLSAALSLLASSITLELRDQIGNICFIVETLKTKVAQTDEPFMEKQGGQTLVLRDSQQAAVPQLSQKSHNESQASQTDAGIGPSLTYLNLGQPQSSRSDAVVSPYAVNLDIARSFCEQGCSEQGCTCACHKRSRIKSLSYLNAVFGSLLVGYSAKPWVTRTCDSADCRSRSTTVTYTYAFPHWFLNRIVTLKMAYDQSRGPELCLRFVRVRPRYDSIFAPTATSTDEVAIRHIQLLLSSGEASVRDVDPYGRSALHVRSKSFLRTIQV